MWWTCVCKTVVLFAHLTVVILLSRFPNCDSSFCKMPHRMQGLHVVPRQTTSSPQEESGDCTPLRPRLPSNDVSVVGVT